jgi:hypothetical protein
MVLVFGSSGSTQAQPDFSGRWVLVDPLNTAAELPRSMSVQQPLITKNGLGQPMRPTYFKLTIERYFVAGTRTETYFIGTEGGVVTARPPDYGRPNRPNPQTRVAVRWDGDRLIINTGSYSGSRRDDGPYTERTEMWELDSAGELRVTVNDRGSTMESTSMTTIYRKE